MHVYIGEPMPPYGFLTPPYGSPYGSNLQKCPSLLGPYGFTAQIPPGGPYSLDWVPHPHKHSQERLRRGCVRLGAPFCSLIPPPPAYYPPNKNMQPKAAAGSPPRTRLKFWGVRGS